MKKFTKIILSTILGFSLSFPVANEFAQNVDAKGIDGSTPFQHVQGWNRTNGHYTKRYEAENFDTHTGNVAIRKNGEKIPVTSGISENNRQAHADELKKIDLKNFIVLHNASKGKFVDFSKPVEDAGSYENTIPEGQDTVTWKVNVPKSGFYRVRFKYNNPATETAIAVNGKQLNANRNARDERNCRVTVNNSSDSLSNNGWTGWMIFNISGYNSNDAQTDSQSNNNYAEVRNNTKWNNNYMNVYFKAGKNDLTLGIQAPPGQGVYDGPNLDYFDVTYIGNDYVNASQVPNVNQNFKFQHPGIYYTIDDLKNMKVNKDDPNSIYGKGYQQLKDSPFSSADYQDNPQALIDVGPYNNPNFGGSEFTRDGIAAHFNALRWYLDGDIANAKKAIEIVNDWSYTLKDVGHGNDAKLRFALIGPDYLSAAEILRYSYNEDPTIAQKDKWQEKDIQAFDHFIKDMLIARGGAYTSSADFYPQANGAWDALIGGFNMAAGVYLNDTDLFNTALRQFYRGDAVDETYPSMGSLPNYIYASGESQESSRDEAHAQLGLNGLAFQSDIAWNQGINIYDAYDSRLLKGVLYNATYNLGERVPSETFISDLSRGVSNDGSPFLEIVYNHYVNQTATHKDISAILQATETIARQPTSKNEAGVPVGYFDAMLLSESKATVSLKLQASARAFSRIGDKITINAKVNTNSEIKGVRWQLPSHFRSSVAVVKESDRQLVLQLIRKPKVPLKIEVSASTIKNASVKDKIYLSYSSSRH
ncbi:alginate lyase family protein [Sporolactobacillus shoreicorticis]|uniref:Alginate lyase family protein n=1 Tax=Sporolactobacillus shoreicorticis TaxID=1923877 RepID=A0ABW5S028_9BACL|nr:alginate lyase family protein [Sporolactobacillus shoreicorticis]MCO7124683.1 alginate lyase family protein [Sporolactobacillus shoreicorticis]